METAINITNHLTTLAIAALRYSAYFGTLISYL
jgi:hypothetical protein